MMKSQRLVLRDALDMKKIDSLAWDESWRIYNLVQASDKQPWEKIWLAKDDRVEIHLIKDHLIEVDYFLVRSRSVPVEPYVRVIADNFAVDTLKWLIARAGKGERREERLEAMYRMAVAAGDRVNDGVVAVIEDAFRSSDPEIRHGAIVAVGYIEWPEMRPVLEAAAEDDDADVRSDARLMLEGLAASASAVRDDD